MEPQDPHMLRRRIMLMVLIVMFPVACTKLHDCRPSVSVETKQDCTFNVHEPTACVGEVWTRLTCPIE